MNQGHPKRQGNQQRTVEVSLPSTEGSLKSESIPTTTFSKTKQKNTKQDTEGNKDRKDRHTSIKTQIRYSDSDEEPCKKRTRKKRMYRRRRSPWFDSTRSASETSTAKEQISMSDENIFVKDK